VRQQPNNAFFLNDLSAAFLARAKRQTPFDDFRSALAQAERAIRAAPELNEPYFNRALALEGLGLQSEAVQAWRKVATREGGSPWAGEAESHLAASGRGRARAGFARTSGR